MRMPPVRDVRTAAIMTVLLVSSTLLTSSAASAWSTLECSSSPGFRFTWPQDNVWPVRFFSNMSPSSVGRTEFEGAMYDWNSIYGATDEMSIAGDGYVYCLPDDNAGFGVAGWDDGACHAWGPNEVGVTKVWSQNCVINKAAVYFNSSFNDTVDDRRNTALHELGHYLGFAHEWNLPSIMGYAEDAYLQHLLADDHGAMRGVYGSSNTAAADLYLTRFGSVDVIVPDAASYRTMAPPSCSGFCDALQAGDTITVELTVGNAGESAAIDTDFVLRLGDVVIGRYDSTLYGQTQSTWVFEGVIPFDMQPGTYSLSAEINADGRIPEGNGPTPPNDVFFDEVFVVEPPPGWTCSASFYAGRDGCDCDCGVYDPDCSDGSATLYGCNANTQCSTAWCNGFGECAYDDVIGGCNDGLFCTIDDSCSLGACTQSTPRSCTTEDSTCSQGVCNEDADRCDRLPINEGGACDDGLFCTVDGSCADGQCASQPRDCSALDDQCRQGICDEDADACDWAPAHEDASCDDTNLCTLNDSCTGGHCTGVAKDCSAVAGPCEVAMCNPTTGECYAVPKDNGTPCEDGAFCTVDDTCQAGVCQAGPARSCAHVDDDCNQGMCDDSADACLPQPINEGGLCDDGAFCTVDDTCQAGACVSNGRDCSAFDDQCNVGTCNDGVDTCEATPANEGGSCDDQDPCTVDDSCGSGTCAGVAKDCSAVAGPCEIAMCDAETGACFAVPVDDGTACEDGAFCTVGDTCQAGVCRAGAPRDCSAFDDDCNDDVCNEDADACEAVPVNEGGMCDDASACTDDDICRNGACVGVARDCSSLDDDCHVGMCDDATGACHAEVAHIGASCDDGDLCTDNDVCQPDGSCGGGDVDCSDLDFGCRHGVCDVDTGACVTEAVADGTACRTANLCEGEGECVDSECIPGEPVLCDDLDDVCVVGICVGETGECGTVPVDDGTFCEDDPCAVQQACTAGVCGGGVPIDCADLDDDIVCGHCPTSEPPVDSDGCSCDVPSSSTSVPAGWLLAIVLVGQMRRRRRH